MIPPKTRAEEAAPEQVIGFLLLERDLRSFGLPLAKPAPEVAPGALFGGRLLFVFSLFWGGLLPVMPDASWACRVLRFAPRTLRLPLCPSPLIALPLGHFGVCLL
jgi:hypothetical protein